MNETTPPQNQPEPATEPVPAPPAEPRTVYVAQPPHRLNKAALWVGIAAGSVFILAAIFGAGVFVGKNIDGGPRYLHNGPGVVGHHGPMAPMPPMGQRGGPGAGMPGPFGPGGPTGQAPNQPGGAAEPTTTATPRP
ncbi:hypothetical protein CRI77_05980 [Mycolicibacterium duvalii]|nr:hypothetical protein [Mycolicibacterium duvalii]MCV7368224.1 hypothetical protein [Mycolicibacterium duvalii]PEG43424.1 hypothetical protein CRI77_05980 [Mycolicibacterium duvalii]